MPNIQKLQIGGFQNSGGLYAPTNPQLFKTTDYSQYSLKNSPAFKAGVANGDPFSMSLKNNVPATSTNIPVMDVNPQSTNPVGATGGSSLMSAGAGILSTGLNALGTKDKVKNQNDNISGNIRSAVNNTLMASGNPFAMAAGAINTVIDKTGGFTDASKGLGKAADTGNMIASLALPGVGWFTGRTRNYTKSDELANSSGYTGTSATGDKAAQNAGAKLLFGRGKADRMILEQQQRDNLVQDIVTSGAEDIAGMHGTSETLKQKNNYNMLGGWNNKAALAKKGTKFPDITNVRALLKKINDSNMGITPKFEKGGKVNVIPDGALHARNNNMEVEGITHKGIPVITEEDGGVIQHAEIEINEIIFNKDVTEQLEKLCADGSDDAAIEAGKLLTKEIIENTVDNTGLLNDIE